MNEKNKYPKFPENGSLGEKCTFGYTNNIKLQTKRTIFMKPEGYVIFCYKEYNDKFVKYPIIVVFIILLVFGLLNSTKSYFFI